MFFYFEINKVNIFLGYKAYFRLNSISTLFIAFEAVFEATLLTNFPKAPLAKEIATLSVRF